MGNTDTIYNQIVNQASLKEMFEYYGIQKQKGDRYLCPFHNDQHPSMSVTKDDKVFTCWSCHTSGTIIDFVTEMEKLRGNDLSYREVLDFIIKQQHLNIDFQLNRAEQSPLMRERLRKLEIMQNAKNVCVNELNRDRATNGMVYKYLQDRKISDRTIANFEIGYNKNSLLQDTLSDKYGKEDLKSVGILSLYDNRYYDAQYNRVLIPIKNDVGEVVGFGGRSLDASTSVKYKNTTTTELFNKKAILFNYNKAKYIAKRTNELVIVEGYFDAISAWEMNMQNTVALMGVALTEEHVDLLRELNIDGNLDITLCLDNDDTGRKTMYELVPVLVQNGFNVNVIDMSKLNKGKDFNDLLCAGVTKEEIYKHKISGFEYMIKYILAPYIENGNEINSDIIAKVYKTVFSNSCFKNSRYEIRFEEIISKEFNYSREDIKSIVHPTCTLLDVAAKKLFVNAIKENINRHAVKRYAKNPTVESEMLLRYVNQNRVTEQQILQGMNDEKMLLDDKSQYRIQITKFCSEYLMKTPEFQEFAKNYDAQFDRLLDNVYGLDKSGGLVQIQLNPKQRDIIATRFNDNYIDANVKEYMNAHKERFVKLYVVDSIAEFEILMGDDYEQKQSSMSVMKEKGVSYINYGTKFFSHDIENIHKEYAGKYTTATGDEYQLVLVYGNMDGQLNLKPENYISIPEEPQMPEIPDEVYEEPLRRDNVKTKPKTKFHQSD